MNWLHGTLFLLCGLLTGRLANRLIHRLPRGESLVKPLHSICPRCGEKRGLRNTIPILSYLVMRGKCRHCHAPISARESLVEGLCALLFLLCYGWLGLTWALLPACVLCALLVTLAAIDLEHQWVPDSLLIAGLLVAVPFNVFFSALSSWPDMLAGIVAGGGPLLLLAWAGKKLTGKPVMGGGDIKLMGMAGAFLGWQGVLLALCAGSILGGIVGVILLATGKGERGMALPFVPMLAAGILLSLFFAQPLLGWYLGLFQH